MGQQLTIYNGRSKHHSCTALMTSKLFWTWNDRADPLAQPSESSNMALHSSQNIILETSIFRYFCAHFDCLSLCFWFRWGLLCAFLPFATSFRALQRVVLDVLDRPHASNIYWLVDKGALATWGFIFVSCLSEKCQNLHLTRAFRLL